MNTFKSALSYWGDAGCNWLRIKSVLFNVVVFPILVYVLYIVFEIRSTRSSYTQITGTIEKVNGNFLDIKYSYNNKEMTAMNVERQPIQGTQQYNIDSPITIYVNTKNPTIVYLQPPLTRTMKTTIIVLLIVFMVSMLIETLLVFTSKSVCNILGGAELAADVVGTTVNAFR